MGYFQLTPPFATKTYSYNTTLADMGVATATYENVCTSDVLPRGRYLVLATAMFRPNGATITAAYTAGISTNSASATGTTAALDRADQPYAATTSQWANTALKREVTLSASGRIYLIGLGGWSAGTPQRGGSLLIIQIG